MSTWQLHKSWCHVKKTKKTTHLSDLIEEGYSTVEILPNEHRPDEAFWLVRSCHTIQLVPAW